MMTLEALHHFHFIRPWFLLSAIPALLLAFLLFRREVNNNAWQQHIEPALLQPLLKGKINAPAKTIPLLAATAWLIAALALAGPSWEKLPQAVEKRDNALVIIMDVSPSMLAGDVKASRLIAARHKIIDLLALRKEGYTALIAYSGDAHVVAPLTDDTLTIANLLNVLEPGIMPVYGSNIEQALTLALQLFQNGGYPHGDVLLLTDGMTPAAITASEKIMKGKPYTLSIIGIGTEEGAPIPTRDGGFIKNEQGAIQMPQLHAEQLQDFAQSVGGYYSPLQLSDADITPLIEGTLLLNQGKTKKSDREFDQWRDRGVYLTLLLLPFFLLAFRRGALFSLVLIVPLLTAPHAEASENQWLADWDSLWLNNNQRAMKALENRDFETAAKTFNDPEWKARAQYEHGDYNDALKQFRTDSSANGYYNQGNALAKSGQLQEAISAYNEALKKNPSFDDAIYNKKIVEELLKQQQEQKQDSQKNQQNSPDEQKPGQNNPDEKNGETEAEPEKAREENKNQQTDQEAQREQKEPANKKPSDSSEQETNGEKLSPEQKQQLEQALRRVPDDPSGLLRNKFEYYYQKRLQDPSRKDSTLNDEERW